MNILYVIWAIQILVVLSVSVPLALLIHLSSNKGPFKHSDNEGSMYQ